MNSRNGFLLMRKNSESNDAQCGDGQESWIGCDSMPHGKGVGEETATRILRAHPAGCERDSLLKAIHEAEVQYAKTRRFWG